MKPVVVEFIAELHADSRAEEENNFVRAVSDALGMPELPHVSVDELTPEMLPVIHIKSGGTEGLFKRVYQQLPEPYLLLASGKSNSLAASLEILAFLQRQGLKGEILHGDLLYIAKRLSKIARVLSARRRLKEARLGVIGKPSDWLIASEVDYSAVQELLGPTLIDIPMEELLKEIGEVKEIDPALLAQFPEADAKTRFGALQIHSALRSLVEKYKLTGVTVRCFDLLGPYQNTGCLGLSLLNDAGVIAGCEGDVAALLSMVVLNALIDQPVFMANPSRIDVKTNQLVLAHCTVPLGMTEKYTFQTHFESNLGIGIRGVLPTGSCTVFKLAGDLGSYFVSRGNILKNLEEAQLCRTQLQVELEESVDYFLQEPLGNHHLICLGDHADEVSQLFEYL